MSWLEQVNQPVVVCWALARSNAVLLKGSCAISGSGYMTVAGEMSSMSTVWC